MSNAWRYDVITDQLKVGNFTEFSTLSQSVVSRPSDNRMLIQNELIETSSFSKKIQIEPTGRMTVRELKEIPSGYGTDWANRVVANGGPYPSQNSINILDAFANALNSNGLLSLMYSVNCFAPDSLIACLTPLINASGSNLYTNVGTIPFLASDVSINGLSGSNNGQQSTGKGLSSGVNLALFPFAQAGVTTYSNNNVCPVFGINADAPAPDYIRWFWFYNDYTPIGGFVWKQDRISGGGIIAGANYISSSGYISCNGITTSQQNIYSANSISPHQLIGTGGIALTGYPNGILPLFCAFDATLGYEQFTPVQMSFIAFHIGLTATQSNTFFNLIQSMRQQFGGGYV